MASQTGQVRQTGLLVLLVLVLPLVVMVLEVLLVVLLLVQELVPVLLLERSLLRLLWCRLAVPLQRQLALRWHAPLPLGRLEQQNSSHCR